MADAVSIVDAAKERMSSDCRVPVFHAVSQRLQQVLSQPDFGLDDVIRLITVDTGLATQVLRVANSSIYSGLTKVFTIRDAANRIGFRAVLSIAKTVATRENLSRCPDSFCSYLMKLLSRHAICCAVGSKWVASRSGYKELAQQAFMAGLLHDVGKVFLLGVVEEVLNVTRPPAAVRTYISQVLNCFHVRQGYLLMQQWHMPELYCEVVAQHEDELWNTSNPILAMVRLSNLACRRVGIAMHPDPELVLFATPEAELLGLSEVELSELEIIIEDAAKITVNDSEAS